MSAVARLTQRQALGVDTLALIGHTPLIRLSHVEQAE